MSAHSAWPNSAYPGPSPDACGGQVIALEGTAPKRVAITEWDRAEQAQAFYNSKAFKDLEPERSKAVRTIRRYIVEATK